MLLYYVGEDAVTTLIAKRLLRYAVSKFPIDNYECRDLKLRSHGRMLMKELPKLIQLGKKTLVVCVFDSDGECVLDIFQRHCPNKKEDTYCTLNIAIDEGESWLLADPKNFAAFAGIRQMDMMLPLDRDEIEFQYKTSLYIMKEIIPKSKKKSVRDSMSCTEKGKKPPTYNDLWPNYVNDLWDIDEARKRSKSLYRATARIENALSEYFEKQ